MSGPGASRPMDSTAPMPPILADTLSILMLWDKLLPMLFVGAVGCCVGSLLNVIVWRVPQGLDIVSPPSRCPKCQTLLTWRENIPVLGWLLLRGRCRFCKSRISAEYPIVEALVGALFAGTYWLFYIAPPHARVLGVDLASIAPAWAANGAAATWPTLVVILGLFAALFAMTLIDARTFTIPIGLCWFAAILGLLGHAGQVIWWSFYHQRLPGHLQNFKTAWITEPGVDWSWLWTIPTPADAANSWWWIGATLGAAAGLVIALLLLRWGVIRRSFEDYEDWEKQILAEQEAAAKAAAVAGDATSPAPPPSSDPSELWILYPHARREMVREMAFLAPAGVLGWFGGAIAERVWGSAAFITGPDGQLAVDMGRLLPPLWLSVVCGVILGYLVGGLTVWAIRIIGTLVKGQEAMGMGDVHLLAGVGACLGWIAPIAVFWVMAPVIALAVWLGQTLFNRQARRTMPYGPALAAASVAFVLARPWIEAGITAVLRSGQPIHLP